MNACNNKKWMPCMYECIPSIYECMHVCLNKCMHVCNIISNECIYTYLACKLLLIQAKIKHKKPEKQTINAVHV